MGRWSAKSGGPPIKETIQARIKHSHLNREQYVCTQIPEKKATCRVDIRTHTVLLLWVGIVSYGTIQFKCIERLFVKVAKNANGKRVEALSLITVVYQQVFRTHQRLDETQVALIHHLFVLYFLELRYFYQCTSYY